VLAFGPQGFWCQTSDFEADFDIDIFAHIRPLLIKQRHPTWRLVPREGAGNKARAPLKMF